MSAELDALVPSGGTITLSSGVEVEILSLDTIQLVRLIKIFTNGMPPEALGGFLFDLNPDDDTFAVRLIMNLLLAIPNAEREVLEFIRSMVKPTGLLKGPRLSTSEKAQNQELINEFNEALANPKALDTVEILKNVILASADDMRSLGKQIGELLKMVTQGHLPSQSPGTATEN